VTFDEKIINLATAKKIEEKYAKRTPKRLRNDQKHEKCPENGLYEPENAIFGPKLQKIG